MKLSEMTTERSFDVICGITPYIGNIIEDKDLMGTLKEVIKVEDGASQAAIISAGIAKISKIIPIVFKSHKEDVCGVLSIAFEESVENILKQNVLKTLFMIREIVKDKDLIDFFKSCTNSDLNG